MVLVQLAEHVVVHGAELVTADRTVVVGVQLAMHVAMTARSGMPAGTGVSGGAAGAGFADDHDALFVARFAASRRGVGGKGRGAGRERQTCAESKDL